MFSNHEYLLWVFHVFQNELSCYFNGTPWGCISPHSRCSDWQEFINFLFPLQYFLKQMHHTLPLQRASKVMRLEAGTWKNAVCCSSFSNQSHRAQESCCCSMLSMCQRLKRLIKAFYSCWRPDTLLNLDPSLKHVSSEMLEKKYFIIRCSSNDIFGSKLPRREISYG